MQVHFSALIKLMQECCILLLKCSAKNLIRQHSIFHFIIFLFIYLFFFFEKIRLGISCEFSARQKIHMKFQVLFSLKNTNKKKRTMLSAAVLITTSKVNPCPTEH